MNPNNLYDRMEQSIREYGRSVIGVADTPPFTYSVGNAIIGLPELIVVGISPQVATPLINAWSKLMIDRDDPFFDGERVDVGGRFPCLAVCCGDHVRSDYTIQAGQFLGCEDYRVIQMLVPDKAGRFPGDPLCAEPYRNLPVLRTQVVLQ